MVVSFIEQERKLKRITMTEMSKSMGISRRQYYRIVNGKTVDVRLSSVEKALDRLGMRLMVIPKDAFLLK